jgi:predicted dinucleotide-binding enzyme
MRIAIIGGGGKMGQWFADFLSREGHDVVISGRTESCSRPNGGSALRSLPMWPLWKVRMSCCSRCRSRA